MLFLALTSQHLQAGGSEQTEPWEDADSRGVGCSPSGEPSTAAWSLQPQPVRHPQGVTCSGCAQKACSVQGMSLLSNVSLPQCAQHLPMSIPCLPSWLWSQEECSQPINAALSGSPGDTIIQVVPKNSFLW